MSRSYNSKEAQIQFNRFEKKLKKFGFYWKYEFHCENSEVRGPMGYSISPMTSPREIFEFDRYRTVKVSDYLKSNPRLKKDDRRAENKIVRREANTKILKYLRCKEEDVVMNGFSKNPSKYW